MIKAPDSPAFSASARWRAWRRASPAGRKRYAAMEQIARAGILTGISMTSVPGAQRSGMPVLPGVCDTDENLQATIRCTANHGGMFVIAGGLTLADQQRDYFSGVLRECFAELLPLYDHLYPAGAYGPVRSGDPHPSGSEGLGMRSAIGWRARELCKQYSISDPPNGVPRPIIPGDKRALNKRFVEALANECYSLHVELDNAPGERVWAYRKAAWAIEDLEQDVGLTYRQMGRKGLEGIENLGPRLAMLVGSLIDQSQ